MPHDFIDIILKMNRISPRNCTYPFVWNCMFTIQYRKANEGFQIYKTRVLIIVCKNGLVNRKISMNFKKYINSPIILVSAIKILIYIEHYSFNELNVLHDWIKKNITWLLKNNKNIICTVDVKHIEHYSFNQPNYAATEDNALLFDIFVSV